MTDLRSQALELAVQRGKGIGFEHASAECLRDDEHLSDHNLLATSPTMNLTVQTLTNESWTLTIPENAGPRWLYYEVSRRMHIPTDQLRLVCGSRQLPGYDVRALRTFGVEEGSIIAVILRLRGGCYHHAFQCSMTLNPGINGVVSCEGFSALSVMLDIRAALDCASATENEICRVAASFHGLITGESWPEHALLRRLDSLALYRVQLSCIRQTLVRRTEHNVFRWDRDHVLTAMVAFRSMGLPSEVGRLIANHMTLPPEEWETGVDVPVVKSIRLAASERGKLEIMAHLRASSCEPSLLPNRHYRVDLLCEVMPTHHHSMIEPDASALAPDRSWHFYTVDRGTSTPPTTISWNADVGM